MVRMSKRQNKQISYAEQYELSVTSTDEDELLEPPVKKHRGEPEHNEEVTATVEEKLDLTLKKLQCLTDAMEDLVEEVCDLKKAVNHMKQLLNDREKLGEFTRESTTLVSTPINETNPITGPFPCYEPINRVISRPSSKDFATSLGSKAHSLQFNSGLYIDLIEKVLGPQENSILDYKAMVKEAILVTKAVISDLKELHSIDHSLRWSLVDPTVKLEAYKKLEDTTQHLLPLKICSEFWGAHVLVSYFWLRRKSTSGKKRKQHPPPPDKDHGSSNKSKPFSITFLTNQ